MLTYVDTGLRLNTTYVPYVNRRVYRLSDPATAYGELFPGFLLIGKSPVYVGRLVAAGISDTLTDLVGAGEAHVRYAVGDDGIEFIIVDADTEPLEGWYAPRFYSTLTSPTMTVADTQQLDANALPIQGQIFPEMYGNFRTLVYEIPAGEVLKVSSHGDWPAASNARVLSWIIVQPSDSLALSLVDVTRITDPEGTPSIAADPAGLEDLLAPSATQPKIITPPFHPAHTWLYNKGASTLTIRVTIIGYLG